MAAKKTAKKPATKSSQKSANKSATKKTSTSKKQQNSRAKVEENMQSRKKLNPQVKAILLCAVAVIFFALLIIEGDNVWFAVRSFVFGVFGFCFVLIPFVFLYLGILTAKEKEMSHKGAKIALSSLIVVFVCTLIYLCGKTDFNEYSYFNALSEAYTNSSIHMSMCGLLGSVLGYPFRLWLTNAPAIIITVLALIVMIMLLTGITLIDIANLAKKRYEVHRDNRNIRRQRKAERELSSQNDSQAELVSESYDVDDSIYYGSGRRADDNVRIDIPLDKVKKKKKPMSSEDIEDQRIIDIINNANEGLTPDEELDATEVAMRISKSKNTSRKTSGAKQPDPETVPVDVDFDIDEEKEKFEKELKKTQRKNEKSVSSMSISSDEDETPSYSYPPVTLLDPSIDSEGSSAMNEMQNNATKLVDTLKSFGVAASITNICRGPSVTRYELQPAPGVKISKITNLSDDIALNLAANGVRIEAPIPGKAAVGIEVPNKVTSMVSLRELIDSNEFYNSKSKLTCVLGRDISGNVVLTDLSKLPHLLIAGTTGSGKSVCVNSLLMSILFKSSPDEVKLLLIDPKMVEFSKYKGIPHLLVPVVSDAKKAAGSLSWAVSEMLNRYKTFSEYDCKDINSFNKLIDKNLEYIKENTNDDMTEEEKNEVALEVEGLKVPKERMSRIVIAIDELADLMMASPAEVEEAICRLAQMARAAGMHLIIATQRPSVNVITGVIKANIPSRIALKVSSNVDSRTILDNGGAEKLIGRGDMLYSPVGANKPLRVQGCFAKDEEIERVTAYIKEKHRANYNDEIEQKIRKIAAEELSGSGKSKDSPSSSDAPEVDALMEEAIKTVIEQKQASTSLLQRRLKVGYARAGRMIDDMEQMGIVGPHQGSKAREVLITYNEWLERNNALNINPDDTVDYYDEEDE